MPDPCETGLDLHRQYREATLAHVRYKAVAQDRDYLKKSEELEQQMRKTMSAFNEHKENCHLCRNVAFTQL